MRKWGSERHVKQIMEKWSSLSLTSHRSLPPSRANDILNVNTAVIWSGLVGSKITSSWLVAAVTIGARCSLVRALLSHRFLIRTFQAANYARDCCPSFARYNFSASRCTLYSPRYGGGDARFSAVDAANRASRGWSSVGAVSGQDAVGSESGRTDDRANERCQRSLVPKPKELTRKEGRKGEGAGRAIKATRD